MINKMQIYTMVENKTYNQRFSPHGTIRLPGGEVFSPPKIP